MLTYAIIGIPDGLEFIPWDILGGAVDYKEMEKECDLDPNKILPSRTGDLFVIRSRLLRDGARLDYFMLYRSAEEIKTYRLGSFYGAAIVVRNKSNPCHAALFMAALRELAEIIRIECIQKNRFVERLTKAESAIQGTPKCIVKLIDSLESDTEAESPRTPASRRAQEYFFYIEKQINLEDAAQELYKFSLTATRSDIYFSTDEKVHQSVTSKNYLKVLDYPPQLPQLDGSTIGRATKSQAETPLDEHFSRNQVQQPARGYPPSHYPSLPENSDDEVLHPTKRLPTGSSRHNGRDGRGLHSSGSLPNGGKAQPAKISHTGKVDETQKDAGFKIINILASIKLKSYLCALVAVSLANAALSLLVLMRPYGDQVVKPFDSLKISEDISNSVLEKTKNSKINESYTDNLNTQIKLLNEQIISLNNAINTLNVNCKEKVATTKKTK